MYRTLRDLALSRQNNLDSLWQTFLYTNTFPTPVAVQVVVIIVIIIVVVVVVVVVNVVVQIFQS
jgi:hypothetical protein